ncbi:Cof-type HAD-IIB family hydrolase [Symbiobacterium thermophilum]|uniref:Cof-type HAD-IIB family hydrolase n=1 Tax=Symbiobacterium thermophilum TaxID=2734 RepID=UPI0002D66920|nr:Cof-type HAD-IIB family hydrolase [Symbiobacterium thermophilum]
MYHTPIRLLALDLDGTLLRSDQTVSPRNQAAVAACLDRGITVLLATGRFYPAAAPYLEYWPGRPIWLAPCNGAQLFAPGQTEPITQRTLDLDLAVEVLSWIDRSRIMARVYFTTLALINRMTERTLAFMRRLGAQCRYEPALASAVTEPPTKIVLMGDPAEMPVVEAEVRSRWGGRLEVTSSEPDLVELTAPGATKGEVVRALAARLGIDRTQVAAIGNERNDLSMIHWAGLGAAVANAHEAVLAAVPRVVAHHDEDGVGQFIESFLGA